MIENGLIIPSLDILEDTQTVVEQRLAEHPWFVTDGSPGGLVILGEDKGDIAQRINAQLAKLGLAVTVLLPSVGVSHPNLPKTSLDDCTLQVTVFENTIINRKQDRPNKTASQAALMVYWQLHHFILPGINSLVVLQKPGIVRVQNSPPGEIAFDVFFKCPLPLSVPNLFGGQ